MIGDLTDFDLSVPAPDDNLEPAEPDDDGPTCTDCDAAGTGVTERAPYAVPHCDRCYLAREGL